MAANQGNLTVDQAIALWPKAQMLGLRLGSPSRTDGATGDQWLQQFMQKAQTNGYRVVYICLHNYHQTTASGLKSWLEAEHNKYGLPIWLTEFNRTDADTTATTTQVKNYLSQVLPMLESLPYLERYAIFNFPSNSVFNDDGSPSAIGQVYLNTKSNPAYTNSNSSPVCTVAVTSPADNSVISNAIAIPVSATVLPSGAINKVDFYVNDTLAGTAMTEPYAITATNFANGINNIYATVTMTYGETVTSPSVQVTAVPPSLPTTPTNMVWSVADGKMTISWPENYTGWLLQMQANSLGTNWVTLPQSSLSNSMTVPIYTTNAAMFFRMIRP
jgi:hypothetical protein